MLDFSDMDSFDDEKLPKNNSNKEQVSDIENYVFKEECCKNKVCSTCNIIERVREHISKIPNTEIESWLLDAYFNEITWAINVKNKYSDKLDEKDKMEYSTIINSYCARVKFLLNHTPTEIEEMFKNTDFFWKKWSKNFKSNFEEVNKVLQQKIFEELWI